MHIRSSKETTQYRLTPNAKNRKRSTHSIHSENQLGTLCYATNFPTVMSHLLGLFKISGIFLGIQYDRIQKRFVIMGGSEKPNVKEMQSR